MAVGARILERREQEGYLGPEGRVAVLGRRLARRIESLRRRAPKAVGISSGIGAMQAFVPFDGSQELAHAVLKAAFEEGVLLWGAGSSPTKIRMLPPLNVSDEELEAGFAALEKALRRVAAERDLAC
jgi:acetylornithine aminotransferase